MDQNLVEIVCVIDRSGSMDDIKDDAQGGFNSFISTMKESIKDKVVKISLAQFDTQYELLWNGINIKDAPTYILQPRGGTALLDAMGRTMNDVGHRLSKMKEYKRPSRVIFMVLTDGQENSSKEFSYQKIKDMVEHQESKYSWEFMYLSSDLNAMDDARNYSLSGTSGCYMHMSATGGFTGLSGYSGIKGYEGVFSAVADSLTYSVNNNCKAAIYDTDVTGAPSSNSNTSN